MSKMSVAIDIYRDNKGFDFFAAIGVSTSTPLAQVKKAYRKFMLKNHADKLGGSAADSTDNASTVNMIWSELSKGEDPDLFDCYQGVLRNPGSYDFDFSFSAQPGATAHSQQPAEPEILTPAKELLARLKSGITDTLKYCYLTESSDQLPGFVAEVSDFIAFLEHVPEESMYWFLSVVKRSIVNHFYNVDDFLCVADILRKKPGTNPHSMGYMLSMLRESKSFQKWLVTDDALGRVLGLFNLQTVKWILDDLDCFKFCCTVSGLESFLKAVRSSRALSENIDNIILEIIFRIRPLVFSSFDQLEPLINLLGQDATNELIRRALAQEAPISFVNFQQTVNEWNRFIQVLAILPESELILRGQLLRSISIARFSKDMTFSQLQRLIELVPANTQVYLIAQLIDNGVLAINEDVAQSVDYLVFCAERLGFPQRKRLISHVITHEVSSPVFCSAAVNVLMAYNRATVEQSSLMRNENIFLCLKAYLLSCADRQVRRDDFPENIEGWGTVEFFSGFKDFLKECIRVHFGTFDRMRIFLDRLGVVERNWVLDYFRQILPIESVEEYAHIRRKSNREVGQVLHDFFKHKYISWIGSNSDLRSVLAFMGICEPSYFVARHAHQVAFIINGEEESLGLQDFIGSSEVELIWKNSIFRFLSVLEKLTIWPIFFNWVMKSGSYENPINKALRCILPRARSNDEVIFELNNLWLYFCHVRDLIGADGHLLNEFMKVSDCFSPKVKLSVNLARIAFRLRELLKNYTRLSSGGSDLHSAKSKACEFFLTRINCLWRKRVLYSGQDDEVRRVVSEISEEVSRIEGSSSEEDLFIFAGNPSQLRQVLTDFNQLLPESNSPLWSMFYSPASAAGGGADQVQSASCDSPVGPST